MRSCTSSPPYRLHGKMRKTALLLLIMRASMCQLLHCPPSIPGICIQYILRTSTSNLQLFLMSLKELFYRRFSGPRPLRNRTSGPWGRLISQHYFKTESIVIGCGLGDRNSIPSRAITSTEVPMRTQPPPQPVPGVYCDLASPKLWFAPVSVHVGCVIGKVALGQVFLRVPQFPPYHSIIALHTSSEG
jgi:hypothetical protein